MRVFTWIRSVFRSLFRKGELDRELDAELQSYLELLAEEKVRGGMERADAARRARLELGGLEQVKERVRERRLGATLDTLQRDVRYALRALGRRPVFAFTAIATLGLGIGLATAMFSVVDVVLLRPLPVPDAHGLVFILRDSDDDGLRMTAPPSRQLIQSVRENASSFSRIEAYTKHEFDVALANDRTLVPGARVSPGFFSFLGVRARVGRVFLPADGGGRDGAVAVLGYGFWKERYGGDPGVPGRTLTVDGMPRVIVGVLPRGFRIDDARETAVWIPADGASGAADADTAVSVALARLADGVTVEAAQAELDAIVRHHPLAKESDVTWRGRVQTPAERAGRALRRAVLVLQVAAGLVLLIVCVNLANLLLALAETRAREVGLRAALGASRGRLIRQFLVESLTLAALGGALGLLVARSSLAIIPALSPEDLPPIPTGKLSFAFALAISLVGSLAFGLLPALRGSRIDPGVSLQGVRGRRAGSNPRVSLRAFLVAAEVALSVILLACGGALARSFVRLNTADPGFRPAGLLSLSMELPAARYGKEEAQLAFYRRLQDEAAAAKLPGIESTSVASGNVTDLSGIFAAPEIEGAGGRAQPAQLILSWAVAPGYLETVGMPLLRGSDFTAADRRDSDPVVIINEAFARQFLRGEDPIGRRVRLSREWYRIVGVVGDVRLPNLVANDVGRLQVYFPLAQRPGGEMTLVTRLDADAAAASALLKNRIRAIDPAVPVTRVAMVDDLLAESLASERFNAVLMMFFAATALVLAVLGIYGLVAYTVSQRARETGIRIAMGATRTNVLAAVLAGGLKAVAAGIVAGLAGALAASGALAALLHEVSGRDPVMLMLVSVVIAVVAVLAMWLPARRAAGADPLVTLRCE